MSSTISTIVTPNVFKEIKKSKVLLVGAGGIGCELLKDLVLMGYGEIHVVDLDTIDLSNLNRQFLFRHKDIKKAKSETAVNAVQGFNFLNCKVVPYMGNIMDADSFSLDWFDQFKIIFNALDNIQARSHVNKMCLFLKKPCIESGTTGFSGQVTPIFPYDTECYECTTKETPKTFPVCTIRSTPSQPVHCVTWAKNYLFSQLYDEEVEDPSNVGLDLGTDNQEEIENLKKEQNELIELRNMSDKPDFGEKIVEKIFVKDIEKLLLIEDLWKKRAKPKPLQWSEFKPKLASTTSEDVSKGQDLWDISKYVYLFIDSVKRLQKRGKSEKVIEFDKDDEDTLDFVASASNIRSYIYKIPLKSKFDIKQIAGNIIPAIATTNSIIAGYCALQSIYMFQSNSRDLCKMIYTFQDNARFTSTSSLFEKNKKCPACSMQRSVLKLKSFDVKLQDLLSFVLKKLNYSHESISLVLGADKLVYDEDFDDNLDEPISKLGFKRGLVLSVRDELDELESVELYMELSDVEDFEMESLKLNKKVVQKPDDSEKAVESATETIVVSEDRKRAGDETGGDAKRAKVVDEVIEL